MRVSGAIPAVSVQPNELKMRSSGSGAHGHHSLGNSFVRVGGGGACATCGKALQAFVKVRACRFCDTVVHRKCAADCPPTCAAASLQHADEVSPVDSAGTVTVPARSLRGFVEVTPPGFGRALERVFAVLGRDAVWCFLRDPGREAVAPLRCISLPGAAAQVRGSQVSVAVDGSATWRLELPDAATAEQWCAAVQDSAQAASARLFSPADWTSAPLVPGRVLDPAPSDRPLLERVMAGDPTIAMERSVINADRVTAPLTLCISSSKAPAAGAAGRSLFVSVHVLAGGQVVCHPCGTSAAPAAADGSVAWNEWMIAADSVAQLHGSIVLLFVLHGGEEVLHAHVPLCDEGGQIVFGMRTLYWWKGEVSTFQFSIGKPGALEECGSLQVWFGPAVMPPAPVVYFSSHLLELLTDPWPVLEYDEPADPFTVSAAPVSAAHSSHSLAAPPSQGRGLRRSRIVSTEEEFSPLLVPSIEEVVLRWATRDATDPVSVCKALLACDYADPEQREGAVQFCRLAEASGTRLPRYLAQVLLLHVQRSTYVRAYALRQAFAWNSSLALVSSSLLSVLTFCPHDANGSAVQLLRAMCAPRRIAFSEEVSSRFWGFHALAQQTHCMAPRFALLLQLYLAGLPKALATTVARHGAFSNAINELSRDPARRKVPLAELVKEPRHLAVLGMGPHELPIGPAQLGPLDLEHSKALPSNAAPLLLRFPVLGSTEIRSVIWKAGDDLTTDELVVTLGEAMNMVWKSSGCEARVVSYRVKPTGLRVGAIEMVPGCTSLGKIQGNWKGALFKKSVIVDWLAAQPGNKDNWEAVRTRFAHTLAGAVVFEYIMGLGDRHCDNLLLKPEGDIFHIDFGCSFGRDFGVAQGEDARAKKRRVADLNHFCFPETPFTLTSQMTEVLGTHFDSFVDMVVRAFVEVRRQRNFFVAQVMGALGGRLPHVHRVSDVRVVYDAMMPQLLQPEAERIFRELVRAALDTKQTQVNDALHTFYMQNFYRPPV